MNCIISLVLAAIEGAIQTGGRHLLDGRVKPGHDDYWKWKNNRES